MRTSTSRRFVVYEIQRFVEFQDCDGNVTHDLLGPGDDYNPEERESTARIVWSLFGRTNCEGTNPNYCLGDFGSLAEAAQAYTSITGVELAFDPEGDSPFINLPVAELSLQPAPNAPVFVEERERQSRRYTPEQAMVVIVSTSHMTREDGQEVTRLKRHGSGLHEEWGPFRGAFDEGGWFCTYRGCDRPDDGDGLLYAGGWSDSLVAMLQWARKTGFDYVLFDRDGPEVEGLGTFDW